MRSQLKSPVPTTCQSVPMLYPYPDPVYWPLSVGQLGENVAVVAPSGCRKFRLR